MSETERMDGRYGSGGVHPEKKGVKKNLYRRGIRSSP